MKYGRTYQDSTEEWKIKLEWEDNMSDELTLKKVRNGYILSGDTWTEVYNNFKNVVKELATIFGEGEKKKKGAKKK